MIFYKVLKSIPLDNFKIVDIDINQIKAQYNPNRFKFWNSLHIGPENEVLNMIYSPHYRLLKQYDEQKNIFKITNSSYYKLQKLYGRNNKWIENKIERFINLYNNIIKYGYIEKIIILSKPLIKNKYNDSFEIYEGHHRLSCLLALNKKVITCKKIIR